MPKASTLFESSFEIDRKGFQSTENIGRPESLAAKRKSNPFEWKTSEKNPTNINRNDTKNSNFSGEQPSIDSYKELFAILHSFNNLKFRNKSSCQFESIETLETGTKLYINSTTKNCFCQTIYYIINTISTDAKLLFNQISPLLLGKIVYSPSSQDYQKLIKRANSTFENMETLLKYIGSIADIGRFLLKSYNLELEDSIQLYENINLFAKGLNTNTTVDFEKVYLQTKIIIEQIDFIRNLGLCVELNKFVGYDTEDEAVRIGGVLLENSNLWGALIFKKPEVFDKKNNLSHLPDIVEYKIRQNSSFTHNTLYTVCFY